MSKLFQSTQENTARTWNGMKTNESTTDPIVDLFYKIGSARGKFDTIVSSLAGSIGKDRDLAMRILLWTRDVREGAGERQTFRDAIDFLATNSLITTEEALRVMAKIPELGRWDDLSVFVGTVLEYEALSFWMDAIEGGNGLAAKWAPRKGLIAAKLRKNADLTPRNYRKLVVANTSVVETAMCAKDWSEINFSHVPSMAASRYQKAFGRNATESYEAYKTELAKPQAERDPKVKVNAKAIFPYNIVRNVINGDSNVASAQWDALPDYMEGSEYHGIMPIVDVSGSMGCAAGGGYAQGRDSVTCMDVAISIGMYVAERNRSVFKDEFITFSSNPKMQKLHGDLKTRVHQLRRAEWGMSTNIVKALDLIVNSARKANLAQEDVPKTLLILSDMQFDYCARFDDSALESTKRKFTDAGYECPNVVFWNINSDGNGAPSTADTHGTALVSGFSPSIMKAVLNAEEFTPRAIMMKTLTNSRYDW